MSTVRILGLFNDFDAASHSIREVRDGHFPALNMDDVTIKSPIEHPDVEELLGDRPAPIRKYTLIGSLLGGVLGFLFLASSQGNFFAQHKGGKPIIPLPPDLVLTFELLILGGVYITVLGFLICAGLPAHAQRTLQHQDFRGPDRRHGEIGRAHCRGNQEDFRAAPRAQHRRGGY